MKRIGLYPIGAVMLCTGSVYGFDPATHMYIGSQTFDIWQDFDPDFYDCLVGNYGVPYIEMMTRKFYYIGLMLPDILSEESQGWTRTLINELYNIRDHIPGGPLHIEEHTKNNVQTPIIFDPNPSNDLSKIKEMAEWARDQDFPYNFDHYQKALIYGAYMHLIQDLYARTVVQPSRFGYGYAIESDSALSLPLLFLAECYHDIFTPTYIPNWNFIRSDLYKGAFLRTGGDHDPEDWINMGISNWGYLDFCCVYDADAISHGGWQNYDFLPVQRFVEAAYAVGYNTDNLTQERLESYIHGLGLGMFFAYGYERDFSNLGGAFTHPNWAPIDIIEFVGEIGHEECSFRICDIPILEDLVDWIIWRFIFNAGFPALDIILDFLAIIPSFPDLSHPWPYYFESTDGLDDLWEAVVLAGEDTPELETLYRRARRELEYWENYAQVKKPNLRASYNEEPTNVMAIENRYRNTLMGSENLNYTMDGMSVWNLSRKAGLLGGMYPVDGNYYGQPGVIDMCFEEDGNLVYTETPICVEGNPSYIDLKYDLVTFGPSKVKISGNGETELTYTDLPGPSRQTSTLPVNAQDAINQGIEELSFKAETQAQDGPYYTVMFNSDYRDAYNSTPIIYDNPTYDSLFKSGDPTRVAGENPHSHPGVYWPYVLPMTQVLARPTNLTAKANSYTSIILNWQDNSSLETSYKIERKPEGGSWSEIGSVGQDETTFTDNTVSSRQKYWYRVRACNETLSSLYSESIYEYAIPIWSEDSEALTFNNGHKVVLAPDGTISIVYVDQYNIWYTESTDGGSTWSDDISISNGNRYHPCTCPAIAVASDGTKYVVWRKRGKEIKYTFKTDGNPPRGSFMEGNLRLRALQGTIMDRFM